MALITVRTLVTILFFDCRGNNGRKNDERKCLYMERHCNVPSIGLCVNDSKALVTILFFTVAEEIKGQRKDRKERKMKKRKWWYYIKTAVYDVMDWVMIIFVILKTQVTYIHDSTYASNSTSLIYIESSNIFFYYFPHSSLFFHLR